MPPPQSQQQDKPKRQCSNFEPQAWRKVLCKNCFKTRAEHRTDLPQQQQPQGVSSVDGTTASNEDVTSPVDDVRKIALVSGGNIIRRSLSTPPRDDGLRRNASSGSLDDVSTGGGDVGQRSWRRSVSPMKDDGLVKVNLMKSASKESVNKGSDVDDDVGDDFALITRNKPGRFNITIMQGGPEQVEAATRKDMAPTPTGGETGEGNKLGNDPNSGAGVVTGNMVPKTNVGGPDSSGKTLVHVDTGLRHDGTGPGAKNSTSSSVSSTKTTAVIITAGKNEAKKKEGCPSELAGIEPNRKPERENEWNKNRAETGDAAASEAGKVDVCTSVSGAHLVDSAGIGKLCSGDDVGRAASAVAETEITRSDNLPGTSNSSSNTGQGGNTVDSIAKVQGSSSSGGSSSCVLINLVSGSDAARSSADSRQSILSAPTPADSNGIRHDFDSQAGSSSSSRHEFSTGGGNSICQQQQQQQ